MLRGRILPLGTPDFALLGRRGEEQRIEMAKPLVNEGEQQLTIEYPGDGSRTAQVAR